MKRLDSKTFLPFLESAGVGIVYFGAHYGKPSLDMAEEFAQLWADVIASNLVGVRFGYIDGSVETAARLVLGVAELPTVLIVRNGVVTHRFQGRCAGHACAHSGRHGRDAARSLTTATPPDR